MQQARRQLGGRGGNAPPIYFLPLYGIFLGRKKLLVLAGKYVWICDFGQKKPSNFSQNLFFWKSPVFGRKKRLNVRFWPEKAFRFRRRPFFFVDHLFLAGKNVWICDFGQKKPSAFGEDLFSFGDHLFLAGKNFEFAISARKSLQISAKTFFFFNFGKNVWICDFGQKKPSDSGEDFFFYCFFWRSPDFGRKKPLDFGTWFSLKLRLNPIQEEWKSFAPLILILPPRSREAGDAPVMQNTQTTPQKKHFSTLEFTVLRVQAEVLAISEVEKTDFWKKCRI